MIFSQDQDLSEAADEVRLIAREQGRWIKLASAFPFSPTARNTPGSTRPTGCELTGRPMIAASIRVTTGRDEAHDALEPLGGQSFPLVATRTGPPEPERVVTGGTAATVEDN